MTPNDEIFRALGSLESKVDMLISKVDRQHDDSHRLEERVSKLEHESTATKSAIGITVGIVGFASAAIGAMADKFFSGMK